jgi:hypothetical protein
MVALHMVVSASESGRMCTKVLNIQVIFLDIYHSLIPLAVSGYVPADASYIRVTPDFSLNCIFHLPLVVILLSQRLALHCISVLFLESCSVEVLFQAFNTNIQRHW